MAIVGLTLQDKIVFLLSLKKPYANVRGVGVVDVVGFFAFVLACV